MKSSKAIAILAVPFAVCVLLLLGGMCLTPYWECGVDLSVPLAQVWRPVLFTIAVFTVLAAIVLYVDLLVITNFLSKSKTFSYRIVLVALFGGLEAAIPRIFFAAIGGQGVGALSPQVEFLPVAMAGAVFALALDRLVGIQET